MANTFVMLPVPATDGVGAWADVSGIAPSKTLTVDGGPFAGQLYIECANDNQISAAPAPLPVFSAALPNAIEFQATLRFMRVRRVASSQGPAGTPTVVVGGLATAANVFASVAVPTTNGTGAPTSIAGGGDVSTFAVVGPFSGALFIEFSNDGTDFSSNIRFDNGNAIPVTFNGVIASVRVRNQLTSGSSVPTVNVGSGSDFSAGVSGVTSVTAGTGITVTGTGSNPIVNNAGVLGVSGGTNITITGTAQNPVISAPNLVAAVQAGTGISVTGTATAPIVNNTGVLTVTAGTNVTVTGTAANPVINVPSIGVTSIIAGTGISVSGTTAVQVNNTGVLSVTAGTGGVTVTGTGANPVINVPTAVTSVTAGTGISITGTATAPIVNNTGVLTVTAGTNVTVTGTAANPVVNVPSIGVTSVTAGTGISITGTATVPIVNNTGVLTVTAGTGGVSITGTSANPVVNALNTMTLLAWAYGFAGGTPGTIIHTGTDFGLRAYMATDQGAFIPYRMPIAVSDVECWVDCVQFNDAGAGGSFTAILQKNIAASAHGVTVASTGLFQMGGAAVPYIAGNTYGIEINCAGTVGVFVDFTVFARAII